MGSAVVMGPSVMSQGSIGDADRGAFLDDNNTDGKSQNRQIQIGSVASAVNSSVGGPNVNLGDSASGK